MRDEPELSYFVSRKVPIPDLMVWIREQGDRRLVEVHLTPIS